MSLFSPRRYQPRFYPYDHPNAFLRFVGWGEYVIKSPLFGCRMCGNCILQETAFICPMTCPKGLRNGPCGGSTPERCEVDPSRPCTWYQIYERSENMGRTDILLEIQAPLDGRNVGHEQWLGLVKKWFQGEERPNPVHFIVDRKKWNERYDRFFLEMRQPDWWQGDALYHPPAYEQPVSNLERSLKAGRFTVTSEIAPPLSVTRKPLERKIEMLKPYVTAANFTDNASASPRMGSIACSAICVANGMEPVMQLQGRDRSRYSIQSDAIGAAELGIRNILCLSGDHLRLGPGPTPHPVQNDLDAIQMLWILRRMRDDGIYLDGRSIKNRPQFFLGAAASPYAAVPRYEAIREEKKVNAGAQFIQTQPIYDYDRFLEWLEAVDKRNLLHKVYILAGITPLKSARAAHFMADDVPGVVIPEEIVKRMDNASDQAEEGVAIALEIIEKLRSTPGIHGLHIMAVQWEDIVPRLMEESGLPLPMEITEPLETPASD
ncbi:MAG: methylenetetrahydrofolate reductase C-terminal domain-containing protein [Anaerolineales bacterium]|nr:methylenetetrahydrofolate reductase C-terminal domain-containing protein [Anaerolineales bacterium]